MYYILLEKVKEEYDLLYTLCETLNTKLLSYDDTKRREYHNTLRNLNNEISYTLSTAYEMVENCINFICRATDRKIPILNSITQSPLLYLKSNTFDIMKRDEIKRIESGE